MANNARKGRERIRARRKQQQMKSRLTWGGVAVISAAVIGYFIWLLVRPALGEAVALEGSNHVSDGQPIEVVSNPPTSGPHYEKPLPAGFYGEDAPETDLPYPEGYIIHSLEHGYIVFWYNCDLITEGDCLDLKTQIQEVMDVFGGIKLIAFPWPSLETPLVMTSWGRMLEFQEFDAGLAEDFIRANRTKAPEAGAP